jgi:hypothetical protein
MLCTSPHGSAVNHSRRKYKNLSMMPALETKVREPETESTRTEHATKIPRREGFMFKMGPPQTGQRTATNPDKCDKECAKAFCHHFCGRLGGPKWAAKKCSIISNRPPKSIGPNKWPQTKTKIFRALARSIPHKFLGWVLG